MTSLNIDAIDATAATAAVSAAPSSPQICAPPNSPITEKPVTAMPFKGRPNVLSPLKEDEPYLSLSLLRQFHHILDESEDDVSVTVSAPCSPRCCDDGEMMIADSSLTTELIQVRQELETMRLAVEESSERLDVDVLESTGNVGMTTFAPRTPRQDLDDGMDEAFSFVSGIHQTSLHSNQVYDADDDTEWDGIEDMLAGFGPESFATLEGQGTFRERSESEAEESPVSPQRWLREHYCETKEDLDDLYGLRENPLRYLKEVKRTLFL